MRSTIHLVLEWCGFVLLALAVLFVASPIAAQDSAAEALGVSGGIEQTILERLTPAQAEAFLAGADPATIVLEDGTTLEDLLLAGLIDTTSNSVYHPLNQCVVVKTTLSVDGKFAANDRRAYLVRGPSTDLSGQGGSASGCGAAANASAVVLNVKVYAASGNGQAFVYPTGHTSMPSVINVKQSQAANNMVTVAMGSSGDFSVKSSCAAHLVIHTVGYFAPLTGAVGPTGPPGVAGPTGPSGAQGDSGPPGMSNWQRACLEYDSGPGDCQPNTVCTLETACPAGTTIIAGGVSVDGAEGQLLNDVRVVSSYPSSAISWYCTIANPTAGAAAVRFSCCGLCATVDTGGAGTGQLTLVKHVINDDGGTARVSDFAFSVNGRPMISGVAEELPVGTYVADERNLPDYVASPWAGDCAADGTVTLAAGEHKVCEITNDDNPPAMVKLIKRVINDDGGTATVSDFDLFVGGQQVSSGAFNEFIPGTYTVREDTVPGYSPSPWTGDCAADGTVTLGAGEVKICQITNDDDPPARVKLIKHVINDDGGTAQVPDFDLFVGGQQVASGVQYPFDPGTYTVSEQNPPGYTASAWSGDCAADGRVTLVAGQLKVCEITNDDEHIVCGSCEGTVNQLTLRYNGSTPNAHVGVVQKDDGITAFDGIVQPGGTFSFVGQDALGTLTSEIRIYVNGNLNTTIHTSCSQPIGPRLVRGDFEVVAGTSRLGGALCSVP